MARGAGKTLASFMASGGELGWCAAGKVLEAAGDTCMGNLSYQEVLSDA